MSFCREWQAEATAVKGVHPTIPIRSVLKRIVECAQLFSGDDDLKAQSQSDTKRDDTQTGSVRNRVHAFTNANRSGNAISTFRSEFKCSGLLNENMPLTFIHARMRSSQSAQRDKMHRSTSSRHEDKTFIDKGKAAMSRVHRTDFAMATLRALGRGGFAMGTAADCAAVAVAVAAVVEPLPGDRKSTRLNSSHT